MQTNTAEESSFSMSVLDPLSMQFFNCEHGPRFGRLAHLQPILRGIEDRCRIKLHTGGDASMVDDWITTGQAVRMSRYHPERLRELAREGKIQARKFGTLWQINRQSLLSYLKFAKRSGDARHGPRAT